MDEKLKPCGRRVGLSIRRIACEASIIVVQLEPEQIEILRELAEAARGVERDERLFMVFSTMQTDLLQGPIGRPISDAESRDLQDLASAGLLKVRDRGKGSYSFTVERSAYEFLAEAAAAAPLGAVEDEIVNRYIDESHFKTTYPLAFRRWNEAANLLWGRDPDSELTTIGHKTREAVQEFASAVLQRAPVEGVDPDPAHTVARLRAVIDAHRDQLGEARRHLLDALVAYWGEVNDLLQRQEHGGQKEGEPLAWEDGRRAVFHSALVMYEIDRTIPTD